MPKGNRGDGQVIATWLPRDLANKFREQSRVEERSVSTLIKNAIIAYLERIDANAA